MTRKWLWVPVLIFDFVGCQPPWAAPGAHIQTRAWSPQEAFDCIKNFHDKTFPADPIRVVWKAVILQKQKNDLGSVEAWTVETVNGFMIEYTLEVSHVLTGGARRSYSDTSYYAITKMRRIR